MDAHAATLPSPALRATGLRRPARPDVHEVHYAMVVTPAMGIGLFAQLFGAAVPWLSIGFPKT